eukprot:CAMPEP_0202422208 /NCGR_PEP_ID=MMETSP1128-20130828/50739_1 /ASSEMBLY_ACC=CAM_ASM_000463 /TAXON_ID=3047 /ORGANISM="Dunaliella tertiolecta, Strain CCMP1320" /LENGTH=125 /DNA_ID=CAMNT_0049030261 /DNA_START=561 /DNA_END=937 /DNA_ORIENTATION=-
MNASASGANAIAAAALAPFPSLRATCTPSLKPLWPKPARPGSALPTAAAPATPATPAPSLVLELPHLALEVHHRALVLSPPVLQLRLLAEVLRVSDAPWDGGGLCAAASLLQLPPPLLLALQLAP